MVKYVCMHCEYTWDSETGDETYKVPAGPIEDFPDDWVCPQCAAGIEGIITDWVCPQCAAGIEGIITEDE